MPHAIPDPREPTGETRAPGPDDRVPTRLFYERLEQTGQLVEVSAGADTTSVSPRVTHVRYPNGTVERIGFSAAPYGP